MKKNIESVKVQNMDMLYRARKNADGHVLKSRRIKSPDTGKMPFRFTDPRLKITWFFETQEKYEKFLKKQIM